jgi:pilus assembly protein Flp/PilA
VNTARSVSRLVVSQPVAPTRFSPAIARAQVFLDDASGVTSIEYALLAFLIAIVIIGAVRTAGTNLNLLFSDVAASV